MKISTKGRYAIRVMIDLAEHNNGSYIPLKDIATRQEISLKYIEGIMTLLSKNNIVDGMHGKGGGYRLIKDTDNYTVGEILRITEGELAPLPCIKKTSTNCEFCSRQSFCKTMPMWNDFNKLVNSYFDNISLADLIARETSNDYVI